MTPNPNKHALTHALAEVDAALAAFNANTDRMEAVSARGVSPESEGLADE